jgi:hypothetical protein
MVELESGAGELCKRKCASLMQMEEGATCSFEGLGFRV